MITCLKNYDHNHFLTVILTNFTLQCSLHYRDLIFESLTVSGFFDQQIESDDLCYSVNNLEYVRQALSEFRRAEDQYVGQNENLLEHALMQIEGTIERILM